MGEGEWADAAQGRLARDHGVVAGGVIVLASAALPPTEGVDAVVVPNAPRRIAPLDRALFDRGFLRLADPPGEGADAALVYLRSSLIVDPESVGGRAESRIAMSNLGHNAGFANQLFQYAFLKLYGLRHNAAFETPAWLGERVYDIAPRPPGHALKMHKGDQWSAADHALWTMRRPPVNVDFWGYYQLLPECWRPHRAFLRRLFTPRPSWREPTERWVARHRPPGGTLVAIHLRRGDYHNYDPARSPWFQLIPEEWYLAWLDRLWPSLANPVLFVATDDRAAVLPRFARFNPLTAEDAEEEMEEPRLLADLGIMEAADVLAICNSSFSRMAAILAPPGQRVFLPSLEMRGFEPYDPWASDQFWQRFGAPEGKRRSLVPRFLRRRT